ncbi:Uncharacterised protein [Mycobacteroides abscessus subsp. abscessus]|nr:Uncharacterised protein [Mycobacteroides abscessus subsp. abscessus]
MRGEGVRPGGVCAQFVEHFQQRPHQGVGLPRIVVHSARDLGEKRCGGAEFDARANAVARRAGAEHMGQLLAEPAFHTACGHQHQLRGERVGQRFGEQRTQPGGQRAGVFGSVQV